MGHTPTLAVGRQVLTLCTSIAMTFISAQRPRAVNDVISRQLSELGVGENWNNCDLSN